MRLRRELRLTIGALVAANLMLSFGAIGLLSRMGPAIERIIEDNVYSIAAAEEILLDLAAAEDDVIEQHRRAPIRDALSRAARNITETEEAPALQTIRDHLPAVFDGDIAARRTVVAELREFIAVNREAMRRADAEARRLGRAGAWAAVFVGFTTFAFGLLIGLRLRRRILWPLVELSDVLSAVARGDERRRCRERNAPWEIRDVTRSVNALLDDRVTSMHRPSSAEEDLQHHALSKLLERESRPLAIVDADGDIFRANAALLEQLSADDGDVLRERLRAVARGGNAEPESKQADADAGSEDTDAGNAKGTPGPEEPREGSPVLDVTSLGEHGWLCVIGASNGSARRLSNEQR